MIIAVVGTTTAELAVIETMGAGRHAASAVDTYLRKNVPKKRKQG